jgi:hypothetical protein
MEAGMLFHLISARRVGRQHGFAFATVLAVSSLVLADEPDGVPAAERAARLETTKRILDAMRVYNAPDRQGAPATRTSEPVLRYTDSTRQTSDSTLWIWGGTGRPVAIVAVENYPKNQDAKRWICEVASLSDERISVEYGREIDWTAKKPGLELERLDGAPAPAGQPATRLTQIKQLQRRFTAHEKASIEGRIELRPLAKPLHRYEDADAGIIDGAIVSFANGTNPEVLLVLEARKAGKGAAEWHFGLVQMTGEAVFAELDGKEIWKRGQAEPPAHRDAYVNAWVAPPAE